MRKISIRLIGLLLAVLTCLNYSQATAQSIPPPHSSGEGCVGLQPNGNLFVVVNFDNVTHGTFGNSVFIWIQTSSGIVGPIGPQSVNPGLSGWDYTYDLSPYSSLSLPLECYTIYYFQSQSHPTLSNPQEFAYPVEVCPCEPVEPDNPQFVSCNAHWTYSYGTFGPNNVYFNAKFPPLAVPGYLTPSYPGPVTYLWDFGDATTDNTRSPMHTYPTTPGTYLVCLTVQYDRQPECTVCMDICISREGMVIEEGFAKQGEIIDIYPNPVTNILFTNVNITKAMLYDVYVLDAMGVVHSKFSQQLENGKNKIEINATKLPMGIYTMYIRGGKTLLSKQFSVTK